MASILRHDGLSAFGSEPSFEPCPELDPEFDAESGFDPGAELDLEVGTFSKRGTLGWLWSALVTSFPEAFQSLAMILPFCTKKAVMKTFSESSSRALQD